MADYGFDINVGGDILMQLAKINESISVMGTKSIQEVEKAESAFASMGEKMSETFSGIKNMLLSGLGLSALFEGFEFIKESKGVYDELQKATTDLNQTMKTMGGSVGVSTEHLSKMAEEMSNVTVFTKSSIISAQALMLTFGNVKGKQFEEGMQSAGDYAQKFFKGDLLEASKSLGIALDDPIKGMARLHRTGVSFTDQQKEQIKNLQEAGKLTEAQEIILKEIRRETGGQAEMFAKTDAGQIAMAKKGWEEIQASIGGVVNKIQAAFVPAMMRAQHAIEAGIEWMRKHKDVLKEIILVIGLFTAALAINATIAAFTAAQEAILAFSFANTALGAFTAMVATEGLGAAMLALPITWVVYGIVAIVAALMYCWDNFKGFREFMGGLWGGILQYIKLVILGYQTLGNVIGDIFHGNFSKAIKDGKKGLADLATGFTTGMVDAVKKGADAAGNSKFKFGDVIHKFLPSRTNAGDPTATGDGKKGEGGANQTAQSAMNTSALSGASGGLGQAKVINITFKDAFQKITTTDNKQLPQKGEEAVEQMIRAINNIAYNEGQTQ